MPLTCADIPQLAGLESIVLRGGATASGNRVRWPYVAENRWFKNWVKGGELIFITGISRHRGPQNLAECLYEGKECNIAGLVVLTGDAFIGQLPTTLMRLADELAVPLFEQPYSLPMVVVTETIGRAILQSEQADNTTVPAASLARALVDSVGMNSIDLLIRNYAPLPKDVLLDSADIIDAWLEHQGNYQAMAQALDCHRNTVGNRMARLNHEISLRGEPAERFKAMLLAHLLLRS